MKKIFAMVLVALGASCLISFAQAQTTGVVRTNVLASMYKGCFKNTKESPANKAASNESIKQYCNCVSIKVADAFTNSVVAEVENGRFPAARQIFESTERYCKENYSQF